MELSRVINAFAIERGNESFRNTKGVSMKLMNFRSLDPAYTSGGGVGLTKRGKMDSVIWNEYVGKPIDLALAAEAIEAQTKHDAVPAENEEDFDLSYSAKEGTVSFMFHKKHERSREIVLRRKAQALRKVGKLECEVCQFDFVAIYGPRGYGFIEAHHINPIHAMNEGEETNIADLVLLCANCHRMVHKSKPWLTIDELRDLIGKT